VIRRVVHASGQGRPLAIDTNPRIAKLVFLDVGLMHASLQIDAQLVQEPALYFWAREALNSQVVVDYLIAVGGAVLPIEVKVSVCIWVFPCPKQGFCICFSMPQAAFGNKTTNPVRTITS
jgi:hypothetical protein